MEGYPCIWDPTTYETWVCWDGRWAEWAFGEIAMVAAVMDELSYHRTFLRVPALPREAFRQTD